jgi:hypothetical protein
LVARIRDETGSTIIDRRGRSRSGLILADTRFRLVADTAVQRDIADGVLLQSLQSAIGRVDVEVVHEAVATLASLFLQKRDKR